MRTPLRHLLLAGLMLAFAGIGYEAAEAAAACSPPGNLAQIRNQVRSLINQQRAKQGLPALTADANLQTASNRYACVMATQDHFDHIGPDGSDPGKRARAAGYKWCAIFENIALGQTTAAKAFQDWMNSPGHRANMMQKEAKNLGLGIGLTPGGRWYWGLLLGKKC